MPLNNLSDPQTKEVLALFHFLDTDADGLLSPRSASNLCSALGFHIEPPRNAGDPGATPIGHEDLLSWIDTFYGQALKNKELQVAQQFALLRTFDPFSGGRGSKVTKEAVEAFLAKEQHSVRPEVLAALFEDLGDGASLSKEELHHIIAPRRRAHHRSTAK
jgi:hypothetical protein